MATVHYALPPTRMVLHTEPNRSPQEIIRDSSTEFTLPISLSLFLMYSKQKIQQLVADKSPLSFYSGCTEEQQKDFIYGVKMCGLEADNTSQEQLSSDQFKIDTIITELYERTKPHLNNVLYDALSPDAFEKNLLLQKTAEEMMQKLRSKNCNVVIFTLNHMNLLAACAASTSSYFKV